jgi:hypothetical protein
MHVLVLRDCVEAALEALLDAALVLDVVMSGVIVWWVCLECVAPIYVHGSISVIPQMSDMNELKQSRSICY